MRCSLFVTFVCAICRFVACVICRFVVMNMTVRRIIAAVFIISFAISAPLLLLYASGYRYSLKKAKLEKTGALVIKSEPSGAKIFLNEEEMPDQSPARIGNILPDDYLITVEKENYYSWTKTLAIKTQETTFAENIILFKKAVPELAADQPIRWWNFSPSGKFALYAVTEFSKNYLFLHNLATGKARLLSDADYALDHIIAVWNKDDKLVLIANRTGAAIFSTSLPKQTAQIDFADFDSAPTNFRWSQTESARLNFQIGNALYEYLFSTDKSLLLFTLPTSGELLDYLVAAHTLFVVEKIRDQAVLTKYPLVGEKKGLDKSLNLDSDHFLLLGLYRDRLALQNTEDSSFTIASPNLDQVLYHSPGIKHFNFLAEQNSLLLQGDQEIIILDLTQSNLSPKIITRYSQDVMAARWHQRANYIYALQSGDLYIIELDDRSGRFTLKLPASDVIDFTVTPDDKTLYFMKGNQLWSLALGNKGFLFE